MADLGIMCSTRHVCISVAELNEGLSSLREDAPV